MSSAARARPVRSLLAATALALAAGSSCDGGAERAAPPNVVLVVLDTVRADHLSCYGYPRRTTPEIDALAEIADRYEVARSTAPWTLPSHASLFTGRFPFQHGAEASRSGESVIDANVLPRRETTLAEALASEGYATAAFAANKGYVNERTGLEQGFATFACDRKPSREMSASALAWLDRRDSARPFFLFLNYMDAHRPYNTAPLPPVRARELPPPPPEGESGATYLDALYEEVFGQDDPPPAELVQRAIDAYDLGIANADLGVGVLLDGLRARGLLEGALVIVCSDHGEYFGEHDLVEHSKDVYEPALRIPLIVKRPAQSAGRTIAEPISLADVPGLVMGEMPAAIGARHAAKFPGSAALEGMLAEIKYSRAKDLSRPWGQRFMRERSALYAGKYKLIRSTDGRNELYDLETDPGELVDLFAARPEEARRLMERLATLMQRGSAGPGQAARAPSPEELEELHKTGYFDSEAPPKKP